MRAASPWTRAALSRVTAGCSFFSKRMVVLVAVRVTVRASQRGSGLVTSATSRIDSRSSRSAGGGTLNRHRRGARRREGYRHTLRRWRRQHGNRARRFTRRLGGDDARRQLSLHPCGFVTLSLRFQGLGEQRIKVRIGGIDRQRHFIMATRQVGTAHPVVASGKADHGVDAVRLLAQRLAIGFDRQADIAERELRIAFRDAEIRRLPPFGERLLDRADLELAGAAGSRADGGGTSKRRWLRFIISFPQGRKD